MASPEAHIEIARLFAERQEEDVPLAEARRNWESDAAKLALPEGARISPAIAGGVPAEWMDMPQSNPRRVFLFLHGGGYNAGSPKTHRKLAAYLARETGTRILMPDYRLAPEHPFPAAVKDALLSFGWLLSEGFAPRDIVVGGDSAGGGLALSMLLAMREAGAEMPRAAILLAPWTDLTVSGPSYERLRDNDPIINPERLRRAGTWYAGRRDPRDPMASPLFAELSGLPPLLIHAGGGEVMLDDSTVFAERAAASGVRVTLKVWPELWHVFHHAAPDVPEAVAALGEIGDYVRKAFEADNE
jgi:acetyl esterase/lipase